MQLPTRSLALGALSLSLFACGSGDASNRGEAPTVDGGSSSNGGGTAIEAGTVAPPSAFHLEEEAESGCAATTTATTKVVTTGGVVLSDLQTAGDRFLARVFAGTGVVTFAADGTNVTSPIALGNDPRAVASPSGLLVAGVDDSSASAMLHVRPFDLQGSLAGSVQPLGPARFGRAFAITRSTNATLTAWVAPQFEIRARVVMDDAGQGAPFHLENDAEFDDLTIVAAPLPNGSQANRFLVAWALRRIALSSYRVYSAIVGPTGVTGLTRVLFGGDERITLTKLVARDGAATLLANRDGEPLVVPLDGLGRTTGTARLFHGMRDRDVGGGQGLASSGDRLALVGAHSSGTHALRLLDTEAKPQGGWVCLDAPSPDGFHLASVVADGPGWKLLVATPDGSGILDVDMSGTSAR